MSERKEEDLEKKKSRESNKAVGRSGRCFFFLLILRQNWFCVDEAVARLETQGEAEVRELIIVSDAVEGTPVDLDGESLQEEQKGKYKRDWKRSKGVDRNDMERKKRI